MAGRIGGGDRMRVAYSASTKAPNEGAVTA